MEFLAAFWDMWGVRQKKNEHISQNYFIQELNSKWWTPSGKPVHLGVSGGDRKKTRIETEVITDLTILFLDKLTSGLDTRPPNAGFFFTPGEDVKAGKDCCLLL